MTKAVKELVQAAEEAVSCGGGLTRAKELTPKLHRLQSAIRKVRDEEKAGIRTGFLHLIELADGRKRITATVESRENYFSRAGWAPAGIEASITYSEEVKDLEWARDDLRT